MTDAPADAGPDATASAAEDQATESLVVGIIGEAETPEAPALPVAVDEAPAKPKRRKAAKSTEPEEAGEVAP